MSSFFLLKWVCRYCAFSIKTKHRVLTRPISDPQNPFSTPKFWSPGWNRSATTGRLFANQTNFPSGMKATVDYVHQKGLKFGIYSTRCNLTCARRASSYGHYPLDAETFASWGVDYLKFDDCPGCPRGADPKKLLRAMRDALNETGRKMVYSTELFSADPETRALNHLTRVGGARPSLIPSLCTRFTRAGIEWRR